MHWQKRSNSLEKLFWGLAQVHVWHTITIKDIFIEEVQEESHITASVPVQES